jgi:hypothetical protein
MTFAKQAAGGTQTSIGIMCGALKRSARVHMELRVGFINGGEG